MAPLEKGVAQVLEVKMSMLMVPPGGVHEPALQLKVAMFASQVMALVGSS